MNDTRDYKTKGSNDNELLISRDMYFDHINSTFSVKAIDINSGKTVCSVGNPELSIDRGLGSVLLLTQIIKHISLGKLKLNDYIIVGELPAKEAKSDDSIGLQKNEKVSVYTLLQGLIIQSAPDAIMALAERLAELLTGNPNLRLKGIKDLARVLELKESTVSTVTGRFNSKRPQNFVINDLSTIAKYLFSLPDYHTQILNTTTLEYKARFYKSFSQLVANGKIICGFLFGPNHGEGIVKTNINGRHIAISVCGARDAFHRDYLITSVIDNLGQSYDYYKNNVLTKEVKISPKNDTTIINFIGDTYFGEDYTIARQKKGIKDALTEYGYDYSFEAIKPLLNNGDYNIANFEAVLTDLDNSPFVGVKPYILKGKIKESIESLQKNKIHAVTLGNNHGMDYGIEGLSSTLQAFSNGNIISIGAGLNGQDASEPLRIYLDNREIILFSAYWHRQSAYQEFDWYALGNKAGVSNLSGDLSDRIKIEKSKSPNSIIIVAVHWGLDFQRVHRTQRKYAQQLIDYGADLIIGHGAHMMQEIQNINGKWVLYSIGNGVFNSNGEYDKRKVPPYSFFTQLRIEKNGEMSIRLYPLNSNNLNTFWQTHIVNTSQFNEVITFQKTVGTPLNKLFTYEDGYGPYIEIKLGYD